MQHCISTTVCPMALRLRLYNWDEETMCDIVTYQHLLDRVYLALGNEMIKLTFSWPLLHLFLLPVEDLVLDEGTGLRAHHSLNHFQKAVPGPWKVTAVLLTNEPVQQHLTAALLWVIFMVLSYAVKCVDLGSQLQSQCIPWHGNARYYWQQSIQ